MDPGGAREIHLSHPSLWQGLAKSPAIYRDQDYAADKIPCLEVLYQLVEEGWYG